MGINFEPSSCRLRKSFGILNNNMRQPSQFLDSFYLFKNLCFFFLKYSKYLANTHILARLGSKYPSSSLSLKTYVIRFYLKGIGYKFLRSRGLMDFLKIELGYSVSTYVRIPHFLKIFHKRDKLIIIGFDKFRLINFSKQVFHLRPADAYKGKGVRLSTLPYTKFKAGKQR